MPIRALSDSGPILLVERNLNIGGAKKWSADCQTAEAIMKKIRLSIFVYLIYQNIAYWEEDNIEIEIYNFKPHYQATFEIYCQNPWYKFKEK